MHHRFSFCTRSLALPAAALVSLAAGAAASGQSAPPSYERFREGVFLRYLNAREGEIDETPRIGLSFGERAHRAVLDSGSTGVVVAARMIPNFDQLPSLGDGRELGPHHARPMGRRIARADRPGRRAGAD